MTVVFWGLSVLVVLSHPSHCWSHVCPRFCPPWFMDTLSFQLSWCLLDLLSWPWLHLALCPAVYFYLLVYSALPPCLDPSSLKAGPCLAQCLSHSSSLINVTALTAVWTPSFHPSVAMALQEGRSVGRADVFLRKCQDSPS